MTTLGVEGLRTEFGAKITRSPQEKEDVVLGNARTAMAHCTAMVLLD
jgi:hypothetical protein